jgi:hypothetical protein
VSLLPALGAALAAYAFLMGYACQGAFCDHDSAPQGIYDRLFAWAWARFDGSPVIRYRNSNDMPNDMFGTFDDDYPPESWAALAQRGSRMRVEQITHADAWRMTRTAA